ncbi:MAG: LysR family transcriptional regulator [Gammaproteobacteria bacterium]|nr:LysR family transcriptional regulator [Gammaproteobacteria bacterium]
MDRFHLMTVFVAVAEEQGFAAGARRLGISPPAVTRAIATLEQRLGVKLFNRTTRYVRTTEAGQGYLEDVRRILGEADSADEAASGSIVEPRGLLAITAPAMFGRIFIMPGVVEYLDRFPATQIEALLLDRDVNLLEEGIDIAIRIGELPDSSMRALRVGSVRQVVCASPAYLELHDTPTQLEELTDHNLIVSSAAGNVSSWRFAGVNGMRSQRIKPRLVVTTNDAAIEAASCGFGITRLLSYQVAQEVAAGQLRILLEDFEPDPSPIHVVHREGRFTQVKIRNFIDFISARLRAEPALA